MSSNVIMRYLSAYIEGDRGHVIDFTKIADKRARI